MDVPFELVSAIADAVRDAVLIWFCLVLAVAAIGGIALFIVLRRWERDGRP